MHLQIAGDLRRQIASGDLVPDESLPSLEALTTQWGCSMSPVRMALGVLRDEGLITQRQGARARVKQPPVRRPLRLSAEWSQEQKNLVRRPTEERALRGTVELAAGVLLRDTVFQATYDEVLATEEWAVEFGLPVGVKLLRRTYETTDPAGGRLLWSTSYVPLALIESNPHLLEQDREPWPGGHQHQLWTVGIEVDAFVRSVTAVQPAPYDRQAWNLAPGTPLLLVRSKTIDTRGRVVEISDAQYPADRTHLEFREQLQRFPNDDRLEIQA